MTEKKFRMYNKRDQRMYKKYSLLDISVDNTSRNWIDKDDVVFMQYTWLKDKNWKGIYESDILKRVDKSNYPSWNIQVVRFEEFRVFPLVSAPCSGCREIVGNIYENSELLNNNK